MTRVRLTRKLAAALNGLDVSALRVGDIIELPDRSAKMLIAEGWAALSPDDDVVAQLSAQHSTVDSSHAN